MNTAFKAFVLLDKAIEGNDEAAKLKKNVTNPIEDELKPQVLSLMVRLRAI